MSEKDHISYEPRILGTWAAHTERIRFTKEGALADKREAKRSLREEILRKRGAMDAGSRAALSRSIVARIVELEAYRRSEVVMAYASFGSEPRTDDLLRHILDEGKILVLPRVDRVKGLLDLYEVKDPARDLRPGAWGIREPRPGLCRRAAPDNLDFVLFPGVAFDPNGGRLGYGGGYYDRLLAHNNAGSPVLVAGAFEAQMVEQVPLEAHDVRVGTIVTEQRYYYSASQENVRSRPTPRKGWRGNPATLR